MTARPRIAYLSYSTGQFDARTHRMARSAIDAGYDVTVYARWEPGLPLTEDRSGYRMIRVPSDWRLGVPGLRARARRRVAAAVRRSERSTSGPLPSSSAAPRELATHPAAVSAATAVPLIVTGESMPSTLPWWVPRQLRGTLLSPYFARSRPDYAICLGLKPCSRSRFAHSVGLLRSKRSRSLPTSGTGCGRVHSRRSRDFGGSSVARTDLRQSRRVHALA